MTVLVAVELVVGSQSSHGGTPTRLSHHRVTSHLQRFDGFAPHWDFAHVAHHWGICTPNQTIRMILFCIQLIHIVRNSICQIFSKASGVVLFIESNTGSRNISKAATNSETGNSPSMPSPPSAVMLKKRFLKATSSVPVTRFFCFCFSKLWIVRRRPIRSSLGPELLSSSPSSIPRRRCKLRTISTAFLSMKASPDTSSTYHETTRPKESFIRERENHRKQQNKTAVIIYRSIQFMTDEEE